MGAGPALRLAHAALYATVCVAVSGLGHVLSAGNGLPPASVALAFAVMCGAGWWLAHRERGIRLITGASALGQAVLHAVFSGLHPMRPAAGGTEWPAQLPVEHGAYAGYAHHHHTPNPAPGPDLTALDAFTPVLDGAYAGPAMALAHGVAGLLCGWWLWRGEAVVRQLARCVALLLCAPLRVAERAGAGVPPPPRVPLPPAPRRARRPRDLLALHRGSRRGPPVPSS
ncbi:hypothetical protein [Streptomyces sp. NPDC049881]|uniref:hypothetical protein n=1 Tax=Streptomyces sp. NPDC049881 TaxID=3155778 RepID=UPI00341DC74B